MSHWNHRKHSRPFCYIHSDRPISEIVSLYISVEMLTSTLMYIKLSPLYWMPRRWFLRPCCIMYWLLVDYRVCSYPPFLYRRHRHHQIISSHSSFTASLCRILVYARALQFFVVSSNDQQQFPAQRECKFEVQIVYIRIECRLYLQHVHSVKLFFNLGKFFHKYVRIWTELNMFFHKGFSSGMFTNKRLFQESWCYSEYFRHCFSIYW